MEYKYNEKEYAKKIFKDGFQTKFIKYELLVLVKHLKEEGYTKKQTEEYVYKFCEKYIEGYNKVKFYKTIDKAIMEGRKKDNKLIVINDIEILKIEMEYIDSLDINLDYKKILLAFLVNKKISNKIRQINAEDEEIKLSVYFEGNKKKYSDIYRQSKTKEKYDINLVIADLIKKELVIPIKEGDIVLSYIEQIPKLEESRISDIFYKLQPKNFEDVGWVFDYYKEINNIKVCENCGSLIKTNNNKMKYCKDCADKTELENHRERNKKWYNNKNSDEIEKPCNP